MRDYTIESLSSEERDAAEYHVGWISKQEGFDEEAAKELVTQLLIKMGPQKKCQQNQTS